MAEAQFPINPNMNKIIENKIKSLEARLNGPNSTGNLPIDDIKINSINEIDIDVINNVEQFRSSIYLKKIILLEISNQISLSGHNTINNNDGDNKSLTLGQNNSNRSLGQSGRKKTPPRKAEKKTRALGNYQIDYLTTKIQKPVSNLNVNHNISDIEKINENLNLSLSLHEEPHMEDKEQIEFSSKNVMSHSGLFSLNFSKLKESQSIMDSFLSKARERDSNNTTPNINNILPLQIKSLSNNQSSYVLEENEKLQKEILENKKIILEKDKEIEKFKSKILDHDESIKNISLINKTLDNQLQTFKISFIKFMKEFEEVKRNNKKKWLSEQEYRLGKAVLQRVGQTVIDVWEEGEEILKLNVRVKEIEREKLELENQKGNLSSYLKKRGNTVETNENQDELNSLKELISFKLGSLQKEESKIRETFEKLQIEKTLMILERKRIKEEESSRFGSSQSKEKFPILSNRYLILSLLGKGGYSEVYKAYDLENNIEVACKIHQLNPQWSDSIKENYIRHTIRENQIHKEINHSKIVKHYDTIEIDNNSFCTVLELCSGPDLHTYLKMYKSLPEKEAKGIINQILSGLQYMNKLQRKIIHYDLKPQNIIFHNMEVKISDFGLAKLMENNSDRLELTSQGVGTYWYLPPECFDTSRNPPGISSKVDIWSLGVILYELIFGARPFGQNCTQDKILKEGIILKAKQVAFPAKPIISKPCKEFIEKCLSRRQEERFDVFEALEHEFIKFRKK